MKKHFLATILILAVFGMANAQTTAISADEALTLGQQIASETNNGNPDLLNHFFDIDLLIDRISLKSPILKEESFRTGFRQGFSNNITSYGNKIVAGVKGGHLRLIKTYEKDGHRHLLFRMLNGDGGLNYHDYTLIRVKGAIKALDCFVYLSDEDLSTTMSNVLNTMNINTDQPEISENVKVFAKLSELRSKRDFAGIKQLYDNMDPSLKKDKAVQIIYVLSTEHLDKALYEKELEHYSALFPGATNCYLMQIDLYILREEYDKGLTAVNRLDSIIAKDPFLDFYRGLLIYKTGKKAESVPYFEAAYHYDPGFSLNLNLLILSCVETKQNEKAKSIIAEYKKSPAFQQAELDKWYAKFPDIK